MGTTLRADRVKVLQCISRSRARQPVSTLYLEQNVYIWHHMSSLWWPERGIVSLQAVIPCVTNVIRNLEYHGVNCLGEAKERDAHLLFKKKCWTVGGMGTMSRRHIPGFTVRSSSVSGLHWPCWCEGWAWGACPFLWYGPIYTQRRRVSATTQSSAWIAWWIHTRGVGVYWEKVGCNRREKHMSRGMLTTNQLSIVNLEFNQLNLISRNELNIFFYVMGSWCFYNSAVAGKSN